MSNDPSAHWDAVYGSRSADELSWFQQMPATSVRLVSSVASPADVVLDVGAGAAFLVDRLLDLGYADVTVLDVSAEALATVRSRLHGRPGLHMVLGDVLRWTPDRQYDVWHDRAVFHFLTDEPAIRAYADVASVAVRAGGALVVGTFAEDGPTRCSGLATARYTPDALAGQFATAFEEEHREREEHVTPSGVVQPFTWVVLRRKPGS